MPANKNQIRRFQTLIKMMRENRYPNYNTFVREMARMDYSGKYTLSSKTFQRDIHELKEEYRAPIKYNYSEKGFYLTNPDWYCEDLMIEPFEMKAALISERVACGILPEPMRSEMNKAVSALLTRNDDDGMTEGINLETFQVLRPENMPAVDPNIFLTCYNAWEQRKVLKLKYYSSKKHYSEKIFEPHIFAWHDGNWYLKGITRQDDDNRHDEILIRVLAVHRIKAAEMLDAAFYDNPEILKRIKEKGLFDFETLPDVKLEIFAPFDQAVYEKYSNIPEAVKERKDDSVVLELHDITEYEAAQIVTKACGNAKVHHPEQLKKFIRSIANKILEYQDE